MPTSFRHDIFDAAMPLRFTPGAARRRLMPLPLLIDMLAAPFRHDAGFHAVSAAMPR